MNTVSPVVFDGACMAMVKVSNKLGPQVGASGNSTSVNYLRSSIQLAATDHGPVPYLGLQVSVHRVLLLFTGL